MKNKFYKIAGYSVVSAVVVLICIIVIIVYFTNHFKNIELISITDRQNISKPMLDIDTSSWRSYRNDTYNFSIKYPMDWSIESGMNNVPGIALFPQVLSDQENSYVIKINFENNPNRNSVRIYSDNFFKQIYDGGVNETYNEYEKRRIKVGEYDAYEIRGVVGVDSSISDQIFLANNDLILNIHFPAELQPYNKNVLNPKDNYETALQILSTIKFDK